MSLKRSIVGLIMAAATACSDGSAPTPTATATVTPTQQASLPGAPAQNPYGTPLPGAPFTPTPTATPEVLGPRPQCKAVGYPSGCNDLVAALSARGFDFVPSDYGQGCSGSAAPLAGQVYQTYLTGVAMAVWIYPSPEALRSEWDMSPDGVALSRRESCRLVGTGLVNGNVLINPFRALPTDIQNLAVSERAIHEVEVAFMSMTVGQK